MQKRRTGREETVKDYRESEHDSNRDFNIQHLNDKRKSARKVEDFGANPVGASYEHKDTLRSELVIFFMIIEMLFNNFMLFIFSFSFLF